MSKFFIVKNTLTESEEQYLAGICNTFVHDAAPYRGPDISNYYYKKTIPREDHIKLESFLNLTREYFSKFSYGVDELEPSEIWINKLTPESNLNDPLHIDANEVSTVTFLNSNFKGGDLELEINNKPQLAEAEQGTSLIFEGNKIRHRALPVTSGERFTMVTFWNLPMKNQKTLL